MEFLKKQAAGFYVYCVAAVLAAIAFAIYFSNIANPYFSDKVNPGIVAATVIGIVLIVLLAFGSKLLDSNKLLSILAGLFPAASTFCLFAAAMMFLGIRVYSMAIIYGSSLEANNTSAQTAMAQAVAGLVLYVVAGIAVTVAAFLSSKKES